VDTTGLTVPASMRAAISVSCALFGWAGTLVPRTPRGRVGIDRPRQ